jgi:dTMP kinase
LEVDPKIGMKRVVKRAKKDKFESENGGFHARIRKAYLNIARSQPERVKIILSIGKIDDVQMEIRDIVDEKLRDKR